LSPGSNGTWAETILYAFGGGSEGADPFWGVALDSSGNMYGTTQDTGSSSFGNVYELVPASSGTWAENVLHSFTGGNDGATPWTTVTLDGAGSVYGVTGGGGAHDYGVVFKLTPGSNGIWTEKVLFAFSGGGPGSAPYGGLVLDGAGNLYGVSNYSVFELTPGSNGAWTQKLLYSFSGGSDGAYPLAPLIFDKSGNLYGTTNTGGHHLGTVFELSLGSNGVWTEKVLHRFSPSGGDGVNPNAARLVLDIKGNLYGTTQLGGASNRGVVFEVTP
jgi:uncharacterized repeat protein (TIGR03803 family)